MKTTRAVVEIRKGEVWRRENADKRRWQPIRKKLGKATARKPAKKWVKLGNYLLPGAAIPVGDRRHGDDGGGVSRGYTPFSRQPKKKEQKQLHAVSQTKKYKKRYSNVHAHSFRWPIDSRTAIGSVAVLTDFTGSALLAASTTAEEAQTITRGRQKTTNRFCPRSLLGVRAHRFVYLVSVAPIDARRLLRALVTFYLFCCLFSIELREGFPSFSRWHCAGGLGLALLEVVTAVYGRCIVGHREATKQSISTIFLHFLHSIRLSKWPSIGSISDYSFFSCFQRVRAFCFVTIAGRE